jgi:hypothetical protein
MVVRVRGAIVAAALTVPSVSLAQEPRDDTGDESPAPSPEADKKADAPAEPPASATPEKGFAWEPFGYLRLQYVAAQNDPNVAFVGRDDGFELQNARVGVRGKLGERAAFVVSIDGAVDERTQINVPEGKLRVGLRDAYVDAMLGAGGTLFARAGFFHSLVDPESLVPDTQRAFVDKPLESRGVRATEGYQTQGLTPGRSIGAALRLDGEPDGGTPGFGFELAVQNGADEYASNNDNDKPAASLAGLVRFANDSHVVGAVRYNPRTVGDLPFRQDETDLMVSGGAIVNVGPVGIGAGAVFVRTSFPTTGGPVRNALGGHGQLMVRVGGDAMPIGIGYRFCIFDPSSLITTDRVMEHTAGVVLGVPTYRMRFQLQATHVIEQRELSNSRVQLAAEVSL